PGRSCEQRNQSETCWRHTPNRDHYKSERTLIGIESRRRGIRRDQGKSCNSGCRVSGDKDRLMLIFIRPATPDSTVGSGISHDLPVRHLAFIFRISAKNVAPSPSHSQIFCYFFVEYRKEGTALCARKSESLKGESWPRQLGSG